jgi:hypothetical protein
MGTNEYFNCSACGKYLCHTCKANHFIDPAYNTKAYAFFVTGFLPVLNLFILVLGLSVSLGFIDLNMFGLIDLGFPS